MEVSSGDTERQKENGACPNKHIHFKYINQKYDVNIRLEKQQEKNRLFSHSMHMKNMIEVA